MAFIPKNIDENGGVFGGMFKKRNSVEAAVCMSFCFLITRMLGIFLSQLMTTIIAIISMLLSAIICLVGINNQPVSIAIIDIINFNRTKKTLTLKKPHPFIDPNTHTKRKIRLKKRRGGEGN